MEKTSPATIPDNPADRRKYPRYRYIERVLVRLKDGATFIGTSFEISQGGMSAVFPNARLKPGDVVELVPVLGYEMRAAVRHVHKNMYGFEFIGLTEEEGKLLAEECEKLPLFRTMLDV